MVYERVHFLGDVLELDVAGVHSFGDFAHLGIDLLDFLQLCGGILQFFEYIAILPRQVVVGLEEGGLDVLGMAHHLIFLFELLLLTLHEVRFVEFLVLEAEEILVLTVSLDFFLQLLQLLVGFLVFLVGGVVHLHLFLVAGDDVHHVELEVLFLQQQVLVLRVDVNELFAEFAHLGERHGCVVDEGTAFASGGQFSANDGIRQIFVDVIVDEELPHVISREVEVRLDDAAIPSRLDGLGVGTVA